MKLYDGHGNSVDAAVGLIDDRGCFVTLLDDSDTRTQYYHFSSQNGLIRELSNDNRRLTNKLEKSEKLLSKATEELAKCKQIAKARAERLEKLEQRITIINAAMVYA